MNSNQRYLSDLYNQTNSNWSGWSGDGYVGPNMSGFFGDYSGADGAPAAMAAPVAQPRSSQPYIFSIANTNVSTSFTAQLLGASIANVSGVTNFNNNVAITISYLNNGTITYGQFLQNINQLAFKLAYVQLTGSGTNSTVVPFNPFTVTQTDLVGNSSTMSYTPLLAAGQFQNTVSFLNLSVPVDNFTYFTFTINASTTLQVALYPEITANPAMSVINQSQTQGYSRPAQTIANLGSAATVLLK